jgi:hypothetical protein
MPDERLHIRLLGPIDVRRGHQVVDLGGPQPRADAQGQPALAARSLDELDELDELDTGQVGKGS